MDSKSSSLSEARLTYSPAIDGLRALSVSAVVAYHLDKSWAAGGFLGVEVFLVISGFLITALMVAEHERTGRIALGNFWFRRARRLLPALFTAIAVIVAYMTIVIPDELVDIRDDVIAALAYVTNWFLSYSGQSYFEALGRPSPLRHLWSLAIEEQWYLVWPVVLVGALKLARGRLVVVGSAIAVGALASTVLMAILYDPAVDPSRIYYGTDTRASGLLLGSLLALVWSPWKLDHDLTRSRRTLLDMTTVVGVVGLVVMFWRLDEFSSFLYRGGFLLVGLLTCAVISGVVHPSRSVVSSVLAWKPFVWLGTRSYGLYLWHWPIIATTRERLDVDISGWRLDLLRVGLTIALAEISFRLVESPIRGGAIGKLRTELAGRAPIHTAHRWSVGVAAVALSAAIVALGLSLAIAKAPEVVAATTADVADLIQATTTTASPTTRVAPTTAAPSTTAPDSASGSTSTQPPPTTAAPTTTTTTEARLPRHIEVTGDSVAISMELNFPSDLGDTVVVTTAAIEGCGVVEGGSMLSGGRPRRNFGPCAGFADRWAASALRHEAEIVLVVLGAWEVFDLRIDGTDVAFGSEAHDEIISTGLGAGVAALIDAGMEVALLEVPCYSPVDGGGLAALPERGEVERTRHLTELLRAVVETSDHVHIVTPPPEFCTDPDIASDLDLRWDGVHYGPLGGAFIWGRLLDQLLAIPVDYEPLAS